jgi:hypothetical protein
MSSFELQELPIRFKNLIIIPKSNFFNHLGDFKHEIKGKIIDLLDINGKIIGTGEIEDINSRFDHVNSTITFVDNLHVYYGKEFASVRMNKNDAAQINNDFNQDNPHLFTYYRPLFAQQQSPKGGRKSRSRKTKQRKSRSRKTKQRKSRKQRKTHKRRV